MKFTLNTAEFKSGAEKLLKLSPVSNVPATESVRLTIKGKNCCLSATNTTQSVTTQIVAKSKANVDIVLTEIKTLAKAMKYFTAEEIEFECSGTTLHITCGGRKATKELIDIALFPLIPAVGKKINNAVIYNNKTLKERFNTIKYAIADDTPRPVLTGVYFNGSDIVGLDGHKLAVNTDKELNIKSAFTVPSNTIKLVNDVLGDEIQVINDSKYIEFKDENTTVMSKLLEGEYPKYGDIISKKGKMIMNVNAKEFVNSLNYLKTFKPAKEKLLAHWSGDTIKNADGTADSKIIVDDPAVLDIEIGFNADYMIDALSQFKDDVKIHVESANSPMILTYDKGDITAVVLPVRIKSNERAG